MPNKKLVFIDGPMRGEIGFLPADRPSDAYHSPCSNRLASVYSINSTDNYFEGSRVIDYHGAARVDFPGIVGRPRTHIVLLSCMRSTHYMTRMMRVFWKQMQYYLKADARQGSTLVRQWFKRTSRPLCRRFIQGTTPPHCEPMLPVIGIDGVARWYCPICGLSWGMASWPFTTRAAARETYLNEIGFDMEARLEQGPRTFTRAVEGAQNAFEDFGRAIMETFEVPEEIVQEVGRTNYATRAGAVRAEAAFRRALHERSRARRV